MKCDSIENLRLYWTITVFSMIRRYVSAIYVKIIQYFVHITVFKLTWHWILAIVIGHNISDWDWEWRFGWMFPIIRRDVAVVLIQTWAIFFWCHRLSPFLWHNIFVRLFEDLWIITHCEPSYQDFVRMSSLMVHCVRNSPVTSGFPTPKASNTDHWLFIPEPSGLEGYCRHDPGGRLPDLRNPYLCNRLTDVLRSKFCGIV